MVQELLQWKDASLTPSEVEYTDNEQLTMLNLPRKECKCDSRIEFIFKHLLTRMHKTLHPLKTLGIFT